MAKTGIGNILECELETSQIARIKYWILLRMELMGNALRAKSFVAVWKVCTF